MRANVQRLADAAALVAGALFPFGFAPFRWSILAWLALAALFWLWRGAPDRVPSVASPRRAAWRGFLFGLGMFGVGVSWVYVSLHNFGNMPAPLAAVAVALFVAGLSLFPALLGALQARVAGAHSALFLGFGLPALWVLFEWVRGWILTGFPWLNLGYSQADSWLAGYAPWLGVYGVSLAAAMSAGLLVAAAIGSRRTQAWCLAGLALLWVGGGIAGRVEWTEPAGKPLAVAIVQGNVPLRLKWSAAHRPRIVQQYVDDSRDILAKDAEARTGACTRTPCGIDLVLWPEAAIPGYLDGQHETLAELAQLHRSYGAEFLFGVVERDADRRGYYNSAVSVGREPGVYRKQHLVPFGEYLPLPMLLGWLIDYLHIPMSDFSTGAPQQAPVAIAGQRVAVSVCYEDAFGEEVIRALPAASLLVNVSEDAWFGNSLAPHQRLQMARLRALETERPMLRAANTGPSAAIDHTGAVIARAPLFERRTLTVTVQPRRGATPYVRGGNWPVVLLAAALTVATAVISRRRRAAGASGPEHEISQPQ